MNKHKHEYRVCIYSNVMVMECKECTHSLDWNEVYRRLNATEELSAEMAEEMIAFFDGIDEEFEKAIRAYAERMRGVSDE